VLWCIIRPVRNLRPGECIGSFLYSSGKFSSDLVFARLVLSVERYTDSFGPLELHRGPIQKSSCSYGTRTRTALSWLLVVLVTRHVEIKVGCRWPGFRRAVI